MKKQSFTKLTLLGLAAGLCASQAAQAATSTDQYKATTSQEDQNSGNLGYHLMTEKELLLELNDEGYKTYMSLDAEGKELARQVASARCTGTNLCSGLNACKTERNACAGKGSCKGQGKCALSDKNLAVKLAAKKMAEKRAQAIQK